MRRAGLLILVLLLVSGCATYTGDQAVEIYKLQQEVNKINSNNAILVKKATKAFKNVDKSLEDLQAQVDEIKEKEAKPKRKSWPWS